MENNQTNEKQQDYELQAVPDSASICTLYKVESILLNVEA